MLKCSPEPDGALAAYVSCCLTMRPLVHVSGTCPMCNFVIISPVFKGGALGDVAGTGTDLESPEAGAATASRQQRAGSAHGGRVGGLRGVISTFVNLCGNATFFLPLECTLVRRVRHRPMLISASLFCLNR